MSSWFSWPDHIMETSCAQEELIRRQEESLLQPAVCHSAGALAGLLADDFIEFGSSGRLYNKRQVSAALQHDPARQLSLTDFRVPVLAPDVVLVTYRASQGDATEMQPAHSLRSSVWQLSAGRWQIIFHQGTPAATTKD